MKDGLNIKVALDSLTEHIFCIVPADYIFVCFDFSNKVQASTLWFQIYLVKEIKRFVD